MPALSVSDPRSIGGYQLLERLGSGGMGTVYLGRAESDRLVAIKVVHEQYAHDPQFRVRFQREVTAARRVSGAFTAPVVDADPEADLPWMATAYVPGQTLRARVLQDGPMSGSALRAVVFGLVEALAELHTVQVIHRDLKPDNVLLTAEGPRVIDFGISRGPDHQTMTATGHMLGTPPYMSPEQLSAPHRLTGASDIFSLGSVLVYAATGRGPFDADSGYVAAYRVVHEPAELGSMPEPLRGIALRCLAKNPSDRPGPDALMKAFREVPVAAWSLRGAASGRLAILGMPPVRRRRLRIGVSLAMAMAAVTGAAYTVWDDTASSPKSPAPQKTKVEEAARLAPAGWAVWERELSPNHLNHCLTSGEDVVLCETDGTSQGELAAFAADTGKRMWHESYGRHGDPDLVGTSEDGRLGFFLNELLAPEHFTNEQIRDSLRVLAVDVATGEVRWSTPPGSAVGAFLLPHALVGYGQGGTPVTAWDPTTGEVLWKLSPGPEKYSVRAAGGHLYLEESNRESILVEIDSSTGKTVKTHHLKENYMIFGGARTVLLAPMADANKEAPVKLHLASGKITQTTLTQNARYTEAGNVIYGVERDGTVTAADTRTGRVKWRRETGAEADRSAPLVAEGRVRIGTTDGRVIALDTRDGRILWRSAARRDPNEALRPGVTSLVGVAGGYVHAFSQRRTLFALQPPV